MGDLNVLELRKQCITSLYLCADNVTKYLETGKENEYQKLRSYVEEYCLMEAQDEVAIQALEKAKKETDTTNIETLHERFTGHLSKMAGKRLNVQKHPYVLELNKHIKRGQELARENHDDSDLAITASLDVHLDPVTKRPIEDPVKNTMCGHVYEKSVILNMISTKQTTKCPVAGCGNREAIQKSHLISDDELKFRSMITQQSTIIQDRSVQNLDDSSQ